MVFLCSGHGGNLKFLQRSLERRLIRNLSITNVIADRECSALNFARKKSIPDALIPYDRKSPQTLFQKLSDLNPDLIITTFHKILDRQIVSRFQNKLVNLHYSLLPLFKGMIGTKPVHSALEQGCRFIGTTTHLVTNDVDGGPILGQSVIPVNGNESFHSLMDRVFRSGCLNLLNTVAMLSQKKLRFASGNKKKSGRLIHQLNSPELCFSASLFNESFWKSVRQA